MVGVTFKITGDRELLRNLKQIEEGFKALTPLQFAKQVAKEARSFLRSSDMGYPQQAHTPISITARLRRKGVRGSTAVVVASGIGPTGKQYAGIQESGYPKFRTAKNNGYMTFRLPNGRWVRTKKVGPIPPKHYMEFGAIYARNQMVSEMTRKVQKILKTKGLYRESMLTT